MRPKYDVKAGKIGKKAEKWIDDFLRDVKMPIWKQMGMSYIWKNENGETMKSPDFDIFKHDKLVAGIEVENKHVSYTRFFHEGIDFIADKILRLSKRPVPIFYYLVIGDKSGFYYEEMKTLMEIGTPISKYNKRLRNEANMSEEWFYRVPQDKLKYKEL